MDIVVRYLNGIEIVKTNVVASTHPSDDHTRRLIKVLDAIYAGKVYVGVSKSTTI